MYETFKLFAAVQLKNFILLRHYAVSMDKRFRTLRRTVVTSSKLVRKNVALKSTVLSVIRTHIGSLFYGVSY